MRLPLRVAVGTLAAASPLQPAAPDVLAPVEASDPAAPFVPCSGDLTGAWVVTGVSVEGAPVPRKREGFGTKALRPTGYGMLVIRDNGKFTANTGISVNPVVLLPTSSKRPTCAAMEKEIRSSAGIQSVSCDGTSPASPGRGQNLMDDAARSCLCSETTVLVAMPFFTGRIVVRGSSFGPEGGGLSEYCVKGRTLRWRLAANPNGERFVVTAGR